MLNTTNTETNLSTLTTEIGSRELRKAMERTVERTIGKTNATSDIVSDAIVNMIEHADSFDADRGSVKSWGCRIAANLARNYRKASANNGHTTTATVGKGEESKEVAIEDTLVAEDGRFTVARRSEATALAAAIATLDEDCQTFLRAMADGMGQCEAGALVGWSPATTTRRYKAIVADLADEMG